MSMNLEDPEDLNGNIPDVAEFNIKPFFDIDLDSAEESINCKSKNVLMITLELIERAKENYQDMKIEVLTSIRNIQHHQKCCVYEHTMKNNMEIVRYSACVGYSYEIMEFFKSEGAILECEVCFRLPLPDNCVRL